MSETPMQTFQRYDIQNQAKIIKMVQEAIEGQLIKWNQVRVETINDRTWRAVVPPSYDGFRALFIEVSFSGPDDRSKVGLIHLLFSLIPVLADIYIRSDDHA